MKNLFAITSGMVALSARTVSTPQEMAQTLRGRIDALARANELVSLREYGGEHEKPATLDTLIKVILRPYMRDARDPDSFVLSGPIVPISRSVVTSLSLVLHETVTNAAKYGALSCRDGRIEITWALSEVELHLRWRESGGPSIFGPPSSEGFGSILVQRSVVGQLQGRVDYDWRSEGLVFDLAIPVERLSL